MKYKVKIKNLKRDKPHKKYDFVIDRSSVLGNPYLITFDRSRDQAIESYDDFFNYAAHPDDWWKELDKMVKALKKYGKVRLFCHCCPERCHGEIIRKYLMEAIEER